ncbi:putative rhodanese domain-containing dual specificity protein phosphatase [Grifola frondosa]|uniref:Putative rhodanese domain-containing dual specificity protein phosphatase n=1 Tax=Grifola frondosa TaxID=5627 RepID=A0A1C7M7F0_GRIFR|nr:putative rhodanese domain-containing dual specificity protein phosphatase [Grifola frondosa]
MLSFSSPTVHSSLVVTSRNVRPSTLGLITRTPSEIIPRLYLSGVFTAGSEEQLSSLGITHIISLIEVRPPYPKSLPHLKTLHIPIEDTANTNILQHLDLTTNFIRAALEESKHNVVLVHCAMGISRSATVVCAYLLATTPMIADEAIDFVRSRREIVCPNIGFRTQLDMYVAHLPGRRIHRRPWHKLLRRGYAG